jgi:hypothetical protein
MTITKYVFGSFLETVVLKVTGKLEYKTIGLIPTLWGKSLLLKCTELLPGIYHLISSVDVRTLGLTIYIFLEMRDLPSY